MTNEDTQPSQNYLRWLILGVVALVICITTVIVTVLILDNTESSNAAEAIPGTPCERGLEGFFLLPDGDCVQYDPDDLYLEFTDYGEYFLEDNEDIPYMWYFLMEEYEIDLEQGITTGFTGVIGVEFENQCFPIIDDLVNQQVTVTLEGPNDRQIAGTVRTEAQSFIRRLFSTGDLPVDVIELDYAFRVYFSEPIVERSVIEDYANQVWGAMLSSGWCTSLDPLSDENGSSA